MRIRSSVELTGPRRCRRCGGYARLLRHRTAGVAAADNGSRAHYPRRLRATAQGSIQLPHIMCRRRHATGVGWQCWHRPATTIHRVARATAACQATDVWRCAFQLPRDVLNAVSRASQAAQAPRRRDTRGTRGSHRWPWAAGFWRYAGGSSDDSSASREGLQGCSYRTPPTRSAQPRCVYDAAPVMLCALSLRMMARRWTTPPTASRTRASLQASEEGGRVA